MTVIKRFIAGAVCPRCGEMDCIRTYRDDEREYKECIRCDYEDSMRLDGQPEMEELETRVNRENKPQIEEGAQPLLFTPNPGTSRKDH
ncbi:YheV family putative zinc ribbon protein [uncultured Neptuniibacter sp.]|uniref:YheV family putative zinc ribbon protein n=1 Tax=uncultured Neptuniibacter sp. TaxID=502143 RepID=UPI002638CA9B|nr:YheV family putative zinc ribbon protein [uncultured Neptuniibacter sp.]